MKKKILTVLLLIILLVGVTGCNNKEDKKEETPKIKLTDNLEVEVNSEVSLLSFISDNKDLEIISEDTKVDTSILGEKELVVKYKEEGKEKEYKFTINVKDSTIPVIEYQKELSTTVGTEIDLLKDVKVTDNSKEEIKATVEGEYDFNKEGTYTLKYVATDSSNNKAEEEFTLKVNKKEEKKTTTTNTSSNNSNTKPNNSNDLNNTASSSSNTTTSNNTSNENEKKSCKKTCKSNQTLINPDSEDCYCKDNDVTTPLNKDEFNKHFNSLGYTISDKEEAKYETDTYLVASKSDVPFKIEYYEFKSDVEAKEVYKKYKDSIADYITTSSKNQETKGQVFARIVAVSTDEYIVMSQVKNTLIFIAGTNEYKNIIDTLLKDIKYL